jgi:hypothetical protein
MVAMEVLMDRGIRASLSPNEARTLCRIAADMAPRAPRATLMARAVAQLLKLGLVREQAGKLGLTATGRERYRQISGTTAPGSPPDEIAAPPLEGPGGRR